MCCGMRLTLVREMFFRPKVRASKTTNLPRQAQDKRDENSLTERSAFRRCGPQCLHAGCVESPCVDGARLGRQGRLQQQRQRQQWRAVVVGGLPRLERDRAARGCATTAACDGKQAAEDQCRPNASAVHRRVGGQEIWRSICGGLERSRKCLTTCHDRV